MPNDTIDRAIKRGMGEGEGANYDEVTYEGYGRRRCGDGRPDAGVRVVGQRSRAVSEFGSNCSPTSLIAENTTSPVSAQCSAVVDENSSLPAS